MPDWPHLVAFSLAALVLIVIPGPSVLFSVGRALALGRRGGVLSVVGNAVGLIPLIVAVAVGLGAIIVQSVLLFTIIKIVGATYLVYLGAQAIRHRHRNGAALLEGAAVSRSRRRLLGEGFVVGLTNPKTIAFFVAVLPQFVVASAGPAWLQMLVFGFIFFALAVISDSAWAIAAGSARDWFAKSPSRIANLGAVGGVMMIGLGGTLAFAGVTA
tara:strand:- start:87 stop:728 length:642 start_codon:yes stop_codon:yes gene_type:complete